VPKQVDVVTGNTRKSSPLLKAANIQLCDTKESYLARSDVLCSELAWALITDENDNEDDARQSMLSVKKVVRALKTFFFTCRTGCAAQTQKD